MVSICSVGALVATTTLAKLKQRKSALSTSREGNSYSTFLAMDDTEHSRVPVLYEYSQQRTKVDRSTWYRPDSGWCRCCRRLFEAAFIVGIVSRGPPPLAARESITRPRTSTGTGQ